MRVIDYNSSEKVYGNSIFYSTFVIGLSKTMGLSEDIIRELLVYVNLAMQTLDEQGLSPYRTFDSISKFAELLGASRGMVFMPRISTNKVTERTEITLIDPPCGSNTIIIKSDDKYLFVHSGYAYYRDEMIEVFKKVVPDFDNTKKTILVTHADVDHCGLLTLFDEVIASPKTVLCKKTNILEMTATVIKNLFINRISIFASF